MAHVARDNNAAPRVAISLTGIPHMGRATVVGALVGASLVGSLVTVGLLIAGAGPLAVIAGAHVGAFGGMGFGGMLGAVLQSDRFDPNGVRLTPRASRAAATGRTMKTANEGAGHALHA